MRFKDENTLVATLKLNAFSELRWPDPISPDNQLTRIFDKLGVANRAQAIVFARDHGFRADE